MSTQAKLQSHATTKSSFTPVTSNLLQRACACEHHRSGSECEDCKKKREGVLQRAAVNNSPTHEVPPIVHEVLRSPGQPLDEATRAFMEPRFGHDFSNVRVHTDAKAAESARAVNALAYTVGQDVVFRSGKYTNNTSNGQQLLAHELTHVVQQSKACSSTGFSIIPATHISEQQAEAVSRQVSSNLNSASVRVLPIAGLQRLVGPEISVSPQAIEQMYALLQDFTVLEESGVITAAEVAEVSTAVVEAEAALATATEVVVAGSTAVTVGETTLVASGALAADDVTGVGVADDVAIPFLLVGAAVAFGIGYLIGSSAEEITEAAQRAADAVQMAIDAITRATTRVNTQTTPQTQTQTDTERRRRRRNCFEQNPGAIACDEPVFDGDDIRDEIVAEFLMNNGYQFDDLVGCTQVGSPIGAGEVRDCGLAPAISYHCQVRGTSVPVSIFACLCCDAEGNSRFQWSRPHWSRNLSRRGR